MNKKNGPKNKLFTSLIFLTILCSASLSRAEYDPPISEILPSNSSGQELTQSQKLALTRVLEFYQNMGDKVARNRLIKAITTNRIMFTDLDAGAAAEADRITNKIYISIHDGEVIGSPRKYNTKATVALATSLSHEMIHNEQSGWSRITGWSSEKLGYGNPTEVQTWSTDFVRLQKWAEQCEKRMNTATTLEEKSKWAWTLLKVRDEAQGKLSDYKRDSSLIGKLYVKDLSGKPIKLSQLVNQIAVRASSGEVLLTKAGYSVNTPPKGITDSHTTVQSATSTAAIPSTLSSTSLTKMSGTISGPCQSLFGQGISYYNSGQYQESGNIFSTITAECPSVCEAWFRWGDAAYRNSGKVSSRDFYYSLGEKCRDKYKQN